MESSILKELGLKILLQKSPLLFVAEDFSQHWNFQTAQNTYGYGAVIGQVLKVIQAHNK